MTSTTNQKQTKPKANSLKELSNISFQPLSSKHKTLLSSFDCGDEDLNHYLEHNALKEQTKNLSKVFLSFNNQERLISFFTLSASSIKKFSFPKSKRFPYPLVPVVLIGRLGVDIKFQGKGYGEKTLIEILKTYAKACDFIGSVALVVDAYENVINFYKRYYFQEVKNNKKHSKTTIRLYLLTKTIVNKLLNKSKTAH